MPDNDSPIHKIQPGDDLAQGRDLAAENRRKLAELFPGLVTETAGENGITHAIDVDALRDLVGEVIDDSDPARARREKFGLSWHGKSAARRLALTPSAGTLRPAPTESVDWDTTGNVLIEGDNLEVLKLLQKAYAGKVKLIYIDPPYNTGNDFVYKDDFRDPIGQYQRMIGEADAEGTKLTTNADTGGRFHTTWLNMIYPRLLLARELLREDGVIFISIDDVEVSNLRTLLDDIFGGENFVASVSWQKVYSPANDKKGIDAMHDFVLVYGRGSSFTPNLLPRTAKQDDAYTNPDDDPRGPWKAVDTTRAEHRDYAFFAVTTPSGKEVWPAEGRSWAFTKEDLPRLLAENRLWFGRDGTSKPSKKLFLSEVKQGLTPTTWWPHEAVGHNDEAKKELKALISGTLPFDTPKPTRLIERMLLLGTSSSSSDIVLDFFAGSGTTGHAVMAQNAADGGNRRFVLVQLPEPTGRDDYKTIADLTAERLRRAGKKIREEKAEGGRMKDEKEGQPMLIPDSASVQPSSFIPQTSLDTGFRVFKLDSANVKAWDAPTTDAATPEQIGSLIEGAVDAVKPDRTDADLLWGILINLGLPLDSVIETRAMDEVGAGKTIHIAAAGTLLCCFAKSVGMQDGEKLADALAQIATEKKVEGELTVVLRDTAFAGKDAAKVNLVENLKQRLPDSVSKSRVLSI